MLLSRSRASPLRESPHSIRHFKWPFLSYLFRSNADRFLDAREQISCRSPTAPVFAGLDNCTHRGNQRGLSANNGPGRESSGHKIDRVFTSPDRSPYDPCCPFQRPFTSNGGHPLEDPVRSVHLSPLQTLKGFDDRFNFFSIPC